MGQIMKLMCVAAIALVSAATVRAEDVNGTDWRKMTPNERLLYMDGFMAGVVNACGLVGSSWGDECMMKLKEAVPKKAKSSDLSAAMDQFYADQANLRIPLLQGVGLIVKRFTGRDIEEEVRLYRKLYN